MAFNIYWITISTLCIVGIVKNQDIPKIAPFSFPPNLKIGDIGSVTCSVTSGSRPLKFQWKKDHIDINENTNVAVLTHSDLSAVSIKSIKEENIGNYTCTVSNKYGSNSYMTRLEVPSKLI
ncbi:Down syndrome cell adhesion molecule-like protein 1 homolog [Centruroides sculpturatus]|uniref:Down syndrome cell adhesion molecule-like protein 1 homolog n=1 Tax=Centruroides sculpturatus TaxID=218467 RepID=UPI000C6ED3D0|nr:Down syndrome cell adhesion molecule-like protein 1 homolog [Centruroides sculpturatus]